MNLMLLFGGLLFIVLDTCAVHENDPPDKNPWKACTIMDNGLLRLDSMCSQHILCYIDKLDANSGNSKASGRFSAMNNAKLAAEICWNPGLNGWNAIRITEKNNGQMTFETSDSMALNADFGAVYEPFDEEFHNAQHFVTFLEDYGMSLRIFALDLAFGDADSSNWCKKKCSVKPTASRIDHVGGFNCTEIAFPLETPFFVLNISVFPYLLGCEQYRKDYATAKEIRQDFVDSCLKVPELKCAIFVEFYACYNSSMEKQNSGIFSIRETCEKHIGAFSNVDGFRVGICIHREDEKSLIVKSFLDFSFTDKTFEVSKKYLISSEAVREMMKEVPTFFIEFGNERRQSAIRISNEWIKEKHGIGQVLDHISPQLINGTWAKKLHFIAPSDEDLVIFFQLTEINFSKRIIQRSNLLPYENDPNKYLGTSACDDLGDDCEATRDLVKQIRELEWCGEKRPETTIEQEEEDPLEDGGDISWTKARAQQLYEELRKKCGLLSEVDEQKRPKRQFTYAQKKWEGYARVPVIFDIKNLGEDLAEWEEAIKNGIQLIEAQTCVKFVLNRCTERDCIIVRKSPKSCGQSSIGRNGGLQNLYLKDCPHMDGYAAHELLHALGLHHEHQRADARLFTKLNRRQLKNIGQMVASEDATVGLLPYDYGSIMTYHGGGVTSCGFFSCDNYAMIAHQILYQYTMGQLEKLSFKDAALINLHYCHCLYDDRYHMEPICQNGGYPDPKQCNQCRCPDGYGGPLCEELEQNKNCEYHSARELEAGPKTILFAPEFRCKSRPCICYWRIKPKNGKKTRISVELLTSQLSCDIPCGPKYIEIKYRADKRAQGARICCFDTIDLGYDELKSPWILIEAEAPGVDIIVSAHNHNRRAFVFHIATDGAELVPSCLCSNSLNWWVPYRNPHRGVVCHDPATGRTVRCPSLTEEFCEQRWLCEVFVINGMHRQIKCQNDSAPKHHVYRVECFMRKESFQLWNWNQTKIPGINLTLPELWNKTKINLTMLELDIPYNSYTFWGYRKDENSDPIYINEIQCLDFSELGIDGPPKCNNITNHQDVPNLSCLLLY
uniref:Metalloendopeptidase n=1 Tax=Globodera rostochiensis TaxID=31243 RepID=A0A914H6R0_GLORO